MRHWTKSGFRRRAESVILLAALLLTGPLPVTASGAVCEVYCHGESRAAEVSRKPRVALTFDDGPHGVFTPQVLDLLKKYNVRATFFVVGENVGQYPDILERTLREGHEIGNHTYAHEYLKGKPRDKQAREIDLCDYEIYDHSEYCAHLLRPPGGLYDDNVMKICAERGYTMIIWSVDTRDWTGASAREIEQSVFAGLEDGAIILMHDFNRPDSHTVEALASIIPKIQDLGYEFVTVSQLIVKQT